ncbi:MAG: FAD-dependent oxidoreductase [Pseudomonadota bacterium]
MNEANKDRIAIIGAGVAGVACASALARAGRAVTVFEKSRGVGGRAATRRTRDGLFFDHGAQFFTARDPAFRAFLDEYAQAHAAWSPAGKDREEPWFVGAPAMNALLKPAAAGLDVRLNTQVSEIAPEGDGWRLRAGETDYGVFARVVVAAPAPQTAALAAAAPAVAAAAARVETAPCWALMLAFERPIRLGADVMRAPTNDIAWIARNSAKPGRGGGPETWIVHASPAWSAAHLELEKEDAAAALHRQLTEQIPEFSAAPLYKAAHRWRYAMTTKPFGAPYAANETGTFLAAGDWCLGARIEDAYRSGVAAAEVAGG